MNDRAVVCRGSESVCLGGLVDKLLVSIRINSFGSQSVRWGRCHYLYDVDRVTEKAHTGTVYRLIPVEWTHTLSVFHS